jgi:hypothetical protein
VFPVYTSITIPLGNGLGTKGGWAVVEMESESICPTQPLLIGKEGRRRGLGSWAEVV